ncbi:hypothetical protein FrEUN1fDRAFT_5824, partial [Parafrankia sp. EUN1f]
MVYFNVARLLADLAGVREEPGEQLLVRMVDPGRRTVK